MMIKIHLSKLLGERKMTQKELAQLTGIRPNTISEYYHELTGKFEQLDLICEVLNCSVSDILEYIPNQQKRTGKHRIIEQHGNRKSIEK